MNDQRLAAVITAGIGGVIGLGFIFPGAALIAVTGLLVAMFTVVVYAVVLMIVDQTRNPKESNRGDWP